MGISYRLLRSGMGIGSTKYFNNGVRAQSIQFSQYSQNTINPGKSSLLTKLKEGALHYWMGSKLLVYETKISSKLLFKLLRGEKLIRREYRQLVRTTSDMVRLVPFIIIVAIPFLEFALPVLLKFFPGMLPSTFEDRMQVEERVKKQLKAKLETAKFLQDMAETMVVKKDNGNESNSIKELKVLFEKTRDSGASLTAQEVMTVCQKLGEEVTLDNITRAQLLNLSRFLGLNVFGTDGFLRYQIRKALAKLKKDDEMIQKEGITILTLEELKTACHVRGIRTIGVSETFMRSELSQWIELHTVYDIPSVILVLSRAFALSENVPMDEAIKATVTSLPDPVMTEARVLAEEAEQSNKDRASAEEKLQVLQEQESLISVELEQEKEAVKTENVSRSSKLTSDQMDSLSDAVVTLATSQPAKLEKDELAVLIRAKVDLENITATGKQDSASKLISKQLQKLISEINNEIIKYETEIGKRLQIISPASDGAISSAQLKAIMKMVRNSPKDAERILAAIQTFDTDGDGKIFIQDILKIAEEAENTEGHGIIMNDSGKKGSDNSS